MSIGRISMLEFMKPEDVDAAEAYYKTIREDFFPTLELVLNIRTGPTCPSSYKMGHQSGLSFGGSGSSVWLIMQPAFDVASGDIGLSVS